MDNIFTPINKPIEQIVQTSESLRNKWSSFFGNSMSVTIPYCYYKTGESSIEKMIVIEDNRLVFDQNRNVSGVVLSPIVFVVKQTDTTTSRTVSCFAIVRSKLLTIDVSTGQTITDIEGYFNYWVNRGVQNPYDLLAYYVPDSSLSYLHPFYRENKEDLSDDINTRISKINNAMYNQKKRVLFGTYLISKYFNETFGI